MPSNLAQKLMDILIVKPAKFYIEKPGKFLTYSLGILYGCGTVGQVIALKTNKDIPDKEKKFLIPQELISGTLELATYMLIATRCEALFKTMASKGAVILKGTEAASPMFVKSMEVLGSLIGAVVSLNLVTPLLRNPITSFVQKHFFKGKKIEDKEQLTRPPLPSAPLSNQVQINSKSPFAGFENSIKTGTFPQKSFYKPAFTSNVMKVF